MPQKSQKQTLVPLFLGSTSQMQMMACTEKGKLQGLEKKKRKKKKQSKEFSAESGV